MPATSATITCQSCGMQYDGTGMKNGVQFQCTQCQNMVVVGAPAGKKPAKSMGRPGARPMGGRPAAGGRPGAPGQQGEPGFVAPAPKKDNSMMMFGIIGGVVVLAIVATVIIMLNNQGNAEQQRKDDAARKEKEDKEKQAKQNEAITKGAGDRTATIDAGTAMGSRICEALAGNNAASLDAMFDWSIVREDFATQLEKQTKEPPMKDGKVDVDKKGKPKLSNYQKFLNDPIFCDGEWEKGEDGRYTGLYIGTGVRGPESLRKRLMDEYIAKLYLGIAATLATEEMEKDKNQCKFSITLQGKTYCGRVCMIKSASAGKRLSFYCGALPGETNVRILRFDDPQRAEQLKQLEAKYMPKNGGGDSVESRDPQNPDRNPDNRDPGPDNGGGSDLAEAKKTGATAPGWATNIFRDIRDGKDLTPGQVKTIQDQSHPAEERKAFIGAVVDVLIDKFQARSRTDCASITRNLYAIYNRVVGYAEKDAVYDIKDFSETNDYPVRVWYQFYNEYKGK